MYAKIVSFCLLSTISCFALGDIQHHNLTVGTCRSFQSGNLQIQGASEVDNQSRIITFSAVSVKEKVIDSYTAYCMAALVSGNKLRIDYLDCAGMNCAITSDTTINFYKP